MEKMDEKRQMRDFLLGLVNQQTQAEAARDLLLRKKKKPALTTSPP